MHYRRGTDYGKEKPKRYGNRSGKYFGARGYTPGYLRGKDPTEAYRRTSAPQTEYERKMKNKTERPEVAGFSGNFSPDTSHYMPRTARTVETRISRDQVEKLKEEILERAIEEFKKSNNIAEIPETKYEIMDDTAEKVAKWMTEIRNSPEDKTTVVDFVRTSLRDREAQKSEWQSDIVERVEEKRNQSEISSPEQVQANDSFAESQNLVEQKTLSDSESAVPEAAPSLYDSYLADAALRSYYAHEDLPVKRRNPMYQSDSEIDYG